MTVRNECLGRGRVIYAIRSIRESYHAAKPLSEYAGERKEETYLSRRDDARLVAEGQQGQCGPG
jgi:hypothetical protein